MAQNLIRVAVEQASSGPKSTTLAWRVGLHKGVGNPSGYGVHPQLLPIEAEELANEIRTAAAEARRRNAPPTKRFP